MKSDLRKTAKAYGTVSEEKAMAESEKYTEKLLENIEPEVIVDIDKKLEKLDIEYKKENEKYRGRKDPKEKAKEDLLGWKPKTKLGRDVKDGKIKNIDEILIKKLKILEPEIIDSLLELKSDLMSIGQAKGKFGGGKRRAWRQTQRKTKEGNVPTFSTMAVVGDEKGHIGIGTGRAKETLPARDKATRKAKLSLMKITRSCSAFDCSCSEPHTIPFKIMGKEGSIRLILTPAPQGTGLVVGGELKKILKLAGIKDVYGKTFGQKRTTFNLAKACIDALKKTNSRNEIQ